MDVVGDLWLEIWRTVAVLCEGETRSTHCRCKNYMSPLPCPTQCSQLSNTALRTGSVVPTCWNQRLPWLNAYIIDTHHSSGQLSGTENNSVWRSAPRSHGVHSVRHHSALFREGKVPTDTACGTNGVMEW